MKERKKHRPELWTGNMDSSPEGCTWEDVHFPQGSGKTGLFHYSTLEPHFIMVH